MSFTFFALALAKDVKISLLRLLQRRLLNQSRQSIMHCYGTTMPTATLGSMGTYTCFVYCLFLHEINY
jgi:hypothetical protein